MRSQRNLIVLMSAIALLVILLLAKLSCGQTLADAPFASPYEGICCEECQRVFTSLTERIESLEEQLAAMVKERAAPPKQQNEKVIVMHTFTHCPACDRWKAEQYPIAQQKGYDLRIVIDPPGVGKSVPWFEVINGAKRMVIDRYFFAETL